MIFIRSAILLTKLLRLSNGIAFMKLEELIIGCKKYDAKCQSQLVRNYAPILLSICMRYCGERSMADDALQETFINVFKYIGSYSGQGSFEGWMKRIAVNSSIQLLRKYKPFAFKEDREMEMVFEAEVPSVMSTLGKKEILGLIDQLPKSLRTVFNMYVIEGFSHKEIGEMLSITSSTSRSHLTKARVKMIELLEKQNEIMQNSLIN